MEHRNKRGHGRGDEIALGDLAGFPLSVNWSVLLIGWLLTWSLATGALPHGAPGHTSAAYWLAAAGSAVAFFGSLLAHEVAHAVVARRAGIGVLGITLWLFGGVARLDRAPPTPAADLRVAAAGPLTSLGLAAGFGAVSVLVDAVQLPHLAASVAGWLAGVNLMLGVFNLVPGAPLDGGRVLRATLWRRWGDRHRAATTAVRVGVVVGYALVAIGLAQFLVAGGVGGLWFVFVGWFIQSAARSEGNLEDVRHALDGLRVGDVMSAPGQLRAEASVAAVLEHQAIGATAVGWLVLGAGEQPEALVTIGQLRAVPRALRHATPVGVVATPLERLRVVDHEVPLVGLVHPEDEAGRGAAVVVTIGGRRVGVVTTDDLARLAARGNLR